MQKRVDQFEHVVAFTDGASIENPGKAGAGVSFFGVAPHSGLKPMGAMADVDSGQSSDISTAEEEDPNLRGFDRRAFDGIEGCKNTRLTHLFDCQMHLGIQTNNIAEYSAIIIAHIVLALLKKDHIAIRTDSQLTVKQVKGTFRVKNVRLISVVPIVHDLIKHF